MCGIYNRIDYQEWGSWVPILSRSSRRFSTNDQNLAWPVRGKFTMSLMNQHMDSNHHVNYIVFDESTPHRVGGKIGPADERVTAWGKRHFITQEKLRKITASCYYLKDDTVYICITFSRERVQAFY